MTTFASERNRIKAKLLALGRPGRETKWIAPTSKPVLEFHGWVLLHKIKIASLVVGALILGAALAAIGLKAFLVGAFLLWLTVLVLAKPCP